MFGLPRTPLQQTALEPVCRSTTRLFENLIFTKIVFFFRNDDCLPTTFRTISGQCNNVQQPGAGSSYEPLQRYLSPNYADCLFDFFWKSILKISVVQSPRVARSGNPLPNARTVSKSINQLKSNLSILVIQVSSTFFQLTAAAHRQCSVMMPLWGQFVFNDIVHFATICWS